MTEKYAFCAVTHSNISYSHGKNALAKLSFGMVSLNSEQIYSLAFSKAKAFS